MHAFIVAAKPHYADLLRRHQPLANLDGQAMLALQAAESVYDYFGVELQSQCEAIFSLARLLKDAHAKWKVCARLLGSTWLNE